MRESPKKLPLADRKHPLVYTTALLAFSQIDDLADILSRGKQLKCKRPSVPVWLGFYRSNKAFLMSILSTVLPDIERVFTNTLESIETPAAQGTDGRTEVSQEAFEAALTESFKMEAEDLKRGLPEDSELSDEEFVDLDKDSDIYQFLFLVVLPCFVHYRIDPWSLYRRARRGADDDYLAVCKLIRIDVSILSDRWIMERVNELERTNPTRYELTIRAALSEGAPKPLTPTQAKARLASFLQMLFEDIPGDKSTKMWSIDSQELFDDIEQIKTSERGARDEDLTPKPENFRKAVDRQNLLWKNPDDIQP